MPSSCIEGRYPNRFSYFVKTKSNRADYCGGAAGRAMIWNVCDEPIGVTVVPTILPIDA